VSETLQIEELVDGQTFGRFTINLLFWLFLAMVADGFDIAGLASAAPNMARTWQIAPKAFAPALSASLFGILVGAPLLGYMGDRFGRKPMIVIGSLIFSLGTLATASTRNLDQVVLLRVLTGIGLGGIMPNAVALTAELAPARLRATLIVLMFIGISVGAALPGTIQAWLIPHYGWPVMFWIGGAVPLIVTGCLLWKLPESAKFLATQEERSADLLATIRSLRPDLKIAEGTRITAAPAPIVRGTGLTQILGGAFAILTPMLWVCFAGALMANFFLNSWLPLLFESSGFTAPQSGIAISSYHLGGVLGGLLVSLVLPRFGFVIIAALFLLAALAIASIGLFNHSYALVVGWVLLAGSCTVGAQFGNLAAAGLLYPTALRSRGVGWALGIGRIGSIVGPLLGGLLIGLKVPPSRLFIFAAVPMVVGLIASVVIARLRYAKVGSIALGDNLTPV
jgi:MFS transporter, AAHS family, 4-hydroxybenzoate transporter